MLRIFLVLFGYVAAQTALGQQQQPQQHTQQPPPQQHTTQNSSQAKTTVPDAAKTQPSTTNSAKTQPSTTQTPLTTQQSTSQTRQPTVKTPAKTLQTTTKTALKLDPNNILNGPKRPELNGGQGGGQDGTKNNTILTGPTNTKHKRSVPRLDPETTPKVENPKRDDGEGGCFKPPENKADPETLFNKGASKITIVVGAGLEKNKVDSAVKLISEKTCLTFVVQKGEEKETDKDADCRGLTSDGKDPDKIHIKGLQGKDYCDEQNKCGNGQCNPKNVNECGYARSYKIVMKTDGEHCKGESDQVIAHEILHVLGFNHAFEEESAQDFVDGGRGVQPAKNHPQLQKYFNGGTWDHCSIMNYNGLKLKQPGVQLFEDIKCKVDTQNQNGTQNQNVVRQVRQPDTMPQHKELSRGDTGIIVFNYCEAKDQTVENGFCVAGSEVDKNTRQDTSLLKRQNGSETNLSALRALLICLSSL